MLGYYILDFMTVFNFANHMYIMNSNVFFCSQDKPIEISRYVEVIKLSVSISYISTVELCSG